LAPPPPSPHRFPPGAKNIGGYIALFQTLTYAVCGVLEMSMLGERRKGSVVDYSILCLMTQGGMLFTNWCVGPGAHGPSVQAMRCVVGVQCPGASAGRFARVCH